jgi:hypothetical protein
MKTIAKLLALCLMLGTFAFAQTTTTPPASGDTKGDQKAASSDTKDTKGKKGKKGKKDKGDKGKDTKGDQKTGDQK